MWKNTLGYNLPSAVWIAVVCRNAGGVSDNDLLNGNIDTIVFDSYESAWNWMLATTQEEMTPPDADEPADSILVVHGVSGVMPFPQMLDQYEGPWDFITEFPNYTIRIMHVDVWSVTNGGKTMRTLSLIRRMGQPVSPDDEPVGSPA